MDKQKECDELMKQVYRNGFNMYAAINKLKKTCKVPPELPPEVIIKVCELYLKEKASINKLWAWFLKSIEMASKQYFAEKNEREGKELKKEKSVYTLKDIFLMAGMK
jgi:hypothetical protein